MAATIYSFKDLTGVFSHCLAGQISIGGTFNGQIGIGQIVIHMANDITTHEIGVDGAVIPFAIPVYNGVITVQCQQTSVLHKFLLSWYNSIKSAEQSSGDVSNWANAVMKLRNITDGTSHNVTGISPKVNADKAYAVQGGNVAWTLMAANIESING
jgi:hypothetical protein